MGAGADAGATKGVLGDAGAAGDSERGSMADGRARVPEVLAPAELEGFLAWVMGPELLEPTLCAPVGEEVEEAQELTASFLYSMGHGHIERLSWCEMTTRRKQLSARTFQYGPGLVDGEPTTPRRSLEPAWTVSQAAMHRHRPPYSL